MTAPLPPDEDQRLEALREYRVLDTPPEAALDELTLLASQVCQTPMAIISLLDETRQWFKSRVGLDVTHTSRDLAFCAHTILSKDRMMEVEDAHTDPRFSDNALVTGDPYIRFYAGAPLIALDGHALGTLSVLDRKPRTLSDEQRKALQILSRHVVTQLELHRKNDQLAKAEQEKDRLLALAEKSRNALLSVLEDEQQRGKELRESEARFRRLVDSNAQGVMFFHTDGEIIEANDAFLNMTGYTREELEARHLNWICMTPPEFAEHDRRAMEEIAATGTCSPYEKEFLRKDGSSVPALIGAAAFEDHPDEGVCFAVDLTERKKLERQFLRSQRMESIGTLAGGIAHDLNNVLSPIMMSLEVLKMKSLDPGDQDLLDVLSASAERGADMVRQVLSFARGVEGRRMEVQVKHIVRDIEKIANDTFLKHIRIRTILPHGLWTVLGDPTQLHQVLLNLCVNARDAMPTGGKLTVSAGNTTLDAHYAGMNPEAKAGPYVLIQVEDSGTGIPPAVIEKIFDPFFTTKEVGKGTGLGLSTTLAIVRSHGGFIRVESEQGKGTAFKVYLPAQTEGAAETAAKIAAELPRGNGELILVVDDEASVRHITRQTLETFGYRVLLASEGSEGVAIYAARQAEIAAVLTDMTMPVMDGLTSIQMLRKLNPDVLIIAASGLPPSSQVASLGVKHFLPKPYTAETLLRVLKETLSSA